MARTGRIHPPRVHPPPEAPACRFLLLAAADAQLHPTVGPGISCLRRSRGWRPRCMHSIWTPRTSVPLALESRRVHTLPGMDSRMLVTWREIAAYLR